MARNVHLGRVLFGGLVAGLVVNLGELAVNVWLLGDAWADALGGLGLTFDAPALILWGVGSFILGIVGVWIYAATSARYGPGPRTALRAGVAVWAASFLVPSVGFLATGPLPTGLVWSTLLTGLVEVCLGVYVGSWLYREGELAEA